MPNSTLLNLSTISLLGCLLAACATDGATPPSVAGLAPPSASTVNTEIAMRYAAIDDGDVQVPAIDLRKIDPKELRQFVDYPTDQPPGTIVVDPHNRFLYLVMEGGKAMRYGVGVGKAGMEFTGTANVGYKRQWPRWTPTGDMIKRDPDHYQQWATGMDGGSGNPLGARALYLFKDGKDTLYRIHGTTEPESIGKAMSSGCIRMLNQDVIDLYGRVPSGSRVVVL